MIVPLAGTSPDEHRLIDGWFEAILNRQRSHSAGTVRLCAKPIQKRPRPPRRTGQGRGADTSTQADWAGTCLLWLGQSRTAATPATQVDWAGTRGRRPPRRTGQGRACYSWDNRSVVGHPHPNPTEGPRHERPGRSGRAVICQSLEEVFPRPSRKQLLPEGYRC